MSTEGPATFRHHFASVFQSAVAEVGRVTASDGPAGRRTRGASLKRHRQEDYEQAAAEVISETAWGTGAMAQPTSDVPRPEVRRTRGSGASDQIKNCAHLAYRYMQARANGNTLAVKAIESEFIGSSCDPAWAKTIVEYVKYFGPNGSRGEIPYVTATALGERVIEIKSSARIALLADWGTGAAPAAEVIEQIAKLAPDILIHLGDVYYSGTVEEYNINFIELINNNLGTDRGYIPVYPLSGNHDMYCGGSGYYNTIRKLNPEPYDQRSSFFCLRNAEQSWQVLALDTGLNDHTPTKINGSSPHLHDEEFDWHLRRIQEFSGSTIILSHHPLFSAFSKISTDETSSINPHLMHFFAEASSKGRVPAWFWGHEHSLCIYEPYAGLERGRCIGFGAIPIPSSENMYGPVQTMHRHPRIISGTELGPNGSTYANGFAILTLGSHDGPSKAEYFQVRGGSADPVFSEEIG